MKNKTALNARLEIVALVSSIIVVVFSGAELGGQVSTPCLIGLIAGSFGAGAALTAAIHKRRDRRLKEKVVL